MLGIEGYTARSLRVKNGQQQYAFCSSHSSGKGRQEWIFDDIGAVPAVVACLTPSERRATALLRMRCCMFEGGGGVGSEYTILKGAAEYVPADFDGAVGRIAIDTTKTKNIRPENINATVQWLLVHNPLSLSISWCGTRTGTSSVNRPRGLTTTPSLPASLPSPARRAGPAIHVLTSKG